MQEAKPLLLELFSGTGSIGRAFRAQGYDVISVDLDPKAKADITKDILDFEVAELDGRAVDVIWASPPCTNYSKARGGTTADELDASDVCERPCLSLASSGGVLSSSRILGLGNLSPEAC